jgi:ribosomal protein S18 acetylase RimI-like enzyme
MSAIRLVRATREDVGDYVRIGARTRSRFNRVTTDPIEAAKEIEASTTYMIEVDDQRVGFVSYISLAADHVYLDEIQVDPDFQGRGIGGFALAAVLDELHAIPLVDLHTHPENPARRLYGRHGFHPVGELIENYQGTGEPRIKMMRER